MYMKRTIEMIEGHPLRKFLTFVRNEFFTEENDHNPLVVNSCPKCINGRTAGEYQGPNKSCGHGRCEECDDTGVSTPPAIELMFTNNNEPISMSCNTYGFLRCPNCNQGFKYYDKRVWSGVRHSCGQKLIINTAAHEMHNKL